MGVFVDAGIPARLIDVKRRPIAGYFRRDKSWDIVVMVAESGSWHCRVEVDGGH